MNRGSRFNCCEERKWWWQSGGMSGNNGAGNGSGQGPPVRRPHPATSFGNLPANRAETRKTIIMSIFKSDSSSSSSS